MDRKQEKRKWQEKKTRGKEIERKGNRKERK